MTHFNLNRMLQGCSAFIQTMAGDRAARNGAKRVNNHVLPLTCPLLASSLRLTCPLQLRRVVMIFAVLVMSTANIGMAWGADVTETRTATNDSEGMKNDGTYVKAVTLGDSNASWSSNKLKIGSSKSTTFDVEINDTYSSSYSIKSIVFTYDGAGRPGSFSGNSIAVTSNTTWSAGATTPTKVTFSLSTSGSEVKIQQMVITLTPSAPATTWYVKGGWNSWGTSDNLAGSGSTLSRAVNITTAGLYEFKIWQNSGGDGTWYGNGGNIGCNISGWTFSTGESANCKFFASETGNYTFTFNTETKKLSVTYPTAQGKYYYKNTGSWGTVAVYRFKGGINNGGTGAVVEETETICGDTYYYTYADPSTTLIFNCNSWDCKTGDMTASGNAGKYVAGTGNSWTAFTYNVTYDKNGGTGTAPTDATNYSSGASVPVKDNTNLAKSGYYFAGWNTKADGSGTTYVLGQTFEITTCTTLYAKWVAVSCPDGSVEGTVFSLTSPTGTVSVPATSSVTITSSQATITNGMATMINGQGSAKNIISSDKINFGHGNTVLRLNLGCALAAGDVISFTSATYKLMVSKTNSTSPGTNNFVVQPSKTENCTIPEGSNLIGLKEVYVVRAEGSTTTFTAMTITRPAIPTCVAPTAVNVTATVNSVAGFQFYPDDDVVLTATPTGSPAGSPVTYQWKKNGSNVGTNSATLTINDAAASDAGKYTCTISYGACSTTSAEFSLKCMQFYLKNSSGSDISNHALTKVDATHATLDLSLTGGTTYMFRVTDGCNDWYGNSDATGMTSSNCTNWTMPHDADCKVTTNSKTGTYTFNFDFTGGVLGSEMKVSIVYPGGDQAADKIIYWDNSVLNWDAGDQWYRIGKNGHNNKTQMTLVLGTANLYKITTTEYNSFEYWHIANNDGNGTGNIFWTKGDAAHAITHAMAFEAAPVTADAVTVTPGTDHSTGTSSDNDNCEFYSKTITNGMKTQNVSITAPSNGTISVAYTDVEGASQSFTSGNRDLAHTVIITPTSTPAEGYTLSGLTVNEAAHTSGNTYTVTANTTIAATFSPASYTVTLNTNGGTINAGNVTSYTYGTGATLPTNVTQSGFTFGGWYDNSGLTGSAVTTISTTATGNKEYWAKWTAAAGDCHKYFYYGALSAPSPAPTKNENSFFSNIPSSGSSLSESWEIDGVTYTTSNRCGNSSNIGTFTVPSGKVATMYVMFNGGSSYTMTIKKGGSDYKTGIDASSGIKKYTEEEMGPGTYAVTTSGNVGLLLLIVDVCDDGPDETAPTFVSSVPANGATDVATSGTIVLTFNEPLGSVDPSKFTLTGATKGVVAIDGSDATKVNIAYSGAANEATVTLETDAAAVSDLAGNALAAALSDISFTTAAAAPATKEIYYGAITITAGALTKGSTGTSQFFTNIGGTIANNTEISWSSGPGTGGEYYESNVLTDTELSKSSNWNTSSGSNRYVGGMKFQSGSTYTLALGSKVASSITFYGRNGSASKTMTVGGEDWTSSATKNTFAKHEFIKTGGFTGDVSITQDGDFYGILVITIQTATPCTTPVIPTLSNQTVCPGSDIAAWNATQTAVLADGETASYSWKKKGNDTEIEDEATLDLGAATESMAGTYVVTVTVSKAGKASATATKEVTLTVTAAVEEPVITANKATVYPGNSVTLTATCGTDGVTWNWYLCANADGTGAGSSLGTSSSYTIASAGAAGTYYYKAVATGSCGTAERVYTLTVTAASECEKYFWFVNAADATTNGVVNNRDGFFTGAPTGSSNSSTYKFTLDGTEYTATKNTGSGSFSISFTIPEGSTATMGINCKGSSSKPLYLTHSSGTPQKLVSNSSSNASCTVENITEGTWTLTSAGSWTLAALGVQVCTTSTCTDATPTITAANTTVCVGSELSIAATGYESDPTSIQWQKLNGSAWDNISGATAATYTVASATAADAGSYRVVVTKGCARTSNTVTISVPSAPNFGSTVPASVSVMQTIALSINTVEATDATKYKWYKSADATWDAGDTEIGTNKELIKAYDGEAIGSPSYYIFCRAQNACGITTSTAIAVNVTAYVEEDCATKGNEGDAEFGFTNTGSVGTKTYNDKEAWRINSGDKYLTYSAPSGKYLASVTFHIAHDNDDNGAYGYSTDNGANWTYVRFTDLTTSWADKMINLSAISSSITDFRIGRKLGSYGNNSGSVWIYSVCFKYTDACTATTVSPSTESTSYVMGGAWSNPTFTLSVAGTLTYSSSNEDIASVDDDGTVTFNGEAGTVTITAAYAGNATYCASEGSYTITVSCPGGAPKVVADGSTVGCSSSITLQAKTQTGGDFADGSYQWFRNGEEIDGATSSSYTATQAGTYTVARTNTSDCTTPSTNSAIVTSETTEPEVERLVPFQYYHVDKTYSNQMKMRHLFAVKNSGTLDGKHFKMYVSRNGGAATDVTSSNALVVVPNGDGHVDTVMVDLNKLSGKYNENDELVFTCKAINCSGSVSDVYKNTITMRVIGATPTLALICSGTDIAAGTRDTKKLTVGGDFLTGYNKADLCQQTGEKSFDANTEWGLYTRLKENYIVTPVNGYAVFNKLNYEPFDILLLTDYPKASKSDAAKDVLDDMADLCDYRPMLSFKTHMVAKTPSKWAAKGFTTSATENKADGKLNLNIVCYAHPMFESIKTGENVYDDVANSSAPLVYTMLTGEGYEGKKGMQGFELAAAENFVTIGLTHYNATITKDSPRAGEVEWTPGTEDRMLVTVAERQTNIEARFILFSLNCGAQSMLTEKGRTVVLKCLEYLLKTDPLEVADCSFTFDNGESNEHDASWYSSNCPSCTGTKGDGKWSTAANWGPDYRLLPGEFTSVRIKKPVEVDIPNAHVMDARIIEEGQITIPASKALEVKSTIRRMEGTEIYPTEANDIVIGSSDAGNGTLIFNNNAGDTKARVDMYSNAQAADPNTENSATNSVWQYIGTPHTDVANARSNYYGSWLYQYVGGTWTVIPNGGPLVAFRGYCITNETAPIVYDMAGTLAATTTQDIAIPTGYTVIANSWVAPIDINAITDDDMENISDKTIYFFNTGTDAEGDNGTGTAAGTYRATPIHSASYTGDWQIPSMQGFYVSTTSAGTFHLDYERHVRPAGGRTIVSNPMYAPRRAKAAEEEEPAVLKIFARGSRYQDKLVVLEREDFTRGYDSGWDGEAWGGSDLSPMVYVTGEGREDAVSAIPEFEGTVIAFKAGEDEAYTLHFEYLNSDEPLYLFDTENNTYTQIMTGNAYYFTTTDKAAHSRFILTRKAPQIATGTEFTSDGESAKARKLLIEDKMYILLNGMLYDATGKVVK